MGRAANVVRVGFGAVGVAVLGYGVLGFLSGRSMSSVIAALPWLIGGVVVHDALLAPLAFAACTLAWRFTGGRTRGALAVILLVGGPVTLVALPMILRRGHNANPTVLALDYPRNLAAVLAVVVVAVAVFSAVASVNAVRLQRWRARDAEAETEAETETETDTETDSIS